jgi:hypothetical protein
VIITGAILIGYFSTITFSEGKTETTITQQQHQLKTEGNTTTTTSNSIALTPHLHNNSTSNSTSNIKKENNNEVAISGENLSATLTRSLSTSNNQNYDTAKPLSISIQSSQNIVNGRGTSTVTAIAYDPTTDKKIDNAIVKLKITFTSNDTSKEIVGHNGEVTYSTEIKPNSKDNSTGIRFLDHSTGICTWLYIDLKCILVLFIIFYINNDR